MNVTFKVGDKIRVNKPTEDKGPGRVDSMDKLDKSILTIKRINDLGYIYVEENRRAFHQDRCTPVVTKTSGLEPHLRKPKPKFKVDVQGHGISTIYIDEAMAKKHRDIMDNYINKQTVELQGWQHQYLLSLSKTKPMTHTLKELRFEEFSKKTQKKLISITEALEEYQQLTAQAGSVIGILNGRAAEFLNQFEKAYENQDKKMIEVLLITYEKFSKIITNASILTALEDINAIEDVPSVL